MTIEKRYLKKRTFSQGIWVWDYSKEEWITLQIGTPKDDEGALCLLPQTDGYRDAYQLRRNLGQTPLEAFGEIHRYITDWHEAKEKS